ncbi:hypothetical protein BS47DRAFT_1365333 [Hydnum rufescens UP504]|uniref:Uncharacterized protein n=1 Tax=Hydnum rufescens UP504 TaxID=1448309 RepID=A0A9P6DSD0_9AGAM|nr:hypothetical protein BS47DRAFT_1365333 [Hydnum rufescens UP504]
MKCLGVGKDLPRTESSVSLVITLDAVAAQEALERHGNPPKSLTDSFDCAMHIAKQAQVLGRFGTPLTSIANRAFATCRLLLLCVPPEGARLPSHPTEQDYRNASILTAGAAPFLLRGVFNTPFPQRILRQTSELLLKGPLDDASAMERALGIILACMTQLGESLEEARGATDVGHILEDIKSILGVKKTTALDGLEGTRGDGVDQGLGPRSDDGGTPGPSAFVLAPETPEDEPTTQNLESSPLSASSDPVGTRRRAFEDDGLHSQHGGLPLDDTSRDSDRSRSPPLLEPGKTSTDAPLIELPMESTHDPIDSIPIPEAKKRNLSLNVEEDLLGLEMLNS